MICSITSAKWLEGSIRITELSLVLLTLAYFFLMARETTPIDMTSRVLEIVYVRSDILFDFLVVLVRVVNAVSPSSTLEGLSIIMMLVSETASVGAAIGSWSDGSTNRARRVGGSLILAELVDLTVRSFKHCGDLGDL